MTQLHNPSTCANGATPKMLTVSLLATAEKRGFDLGGVVGRFLHVSSVFFLGK